MNFLESFQVLGKHKFGREDVNIVESWNTVAIEETEAVCTVGLQVWIVSVKSIVFGIVRVFGDEGKVRDTNSTDNVLVLFECQLNHDLRHNSISIFNKQFSF